MSDLEDDVLMAFLKQARQLKVIEERERLVAVVWKDLDVLLKVLIRLPGVTPLIQDQLGHLHSSVAAVIAFDAEHKDGPDA